MEESTYRKGTLNRKELIALGIEVGGGPATSHARFAVGVLVSLNHDN